jgi:hypothetical protein
VKLSELVAPVNKLLMCGLAKNTGKTVALMSLLDEINHESGVVGVTSIGRDGEQYDAVNNTIKKPSIDLTASNLVATTLNLIEDSQIPYELLRETDFRTPMGPVVICRILRAGSLEVAGPTAAEDINRVCDDMLCLGADRILIDGAINRKAAASPYIADGIVLSTGAILSTHIEEVVSETKNAVEQIRLPEVNDPILLNCAKEARENLCLTKDYVPIRFDRNAALHADTDALEELLIREEVYRYILLNGAMSEAFALNLLKFTRRRELVCVVMDSSKLFLGDRSPSWFAKQGLHIQVVYPIQLKAITVNPVAPSSHRFDSNELLDLLQEAISGVPIINVLDKSFAS